MSRSAARAPSNKRLKLAGAPGWRRISFVRPMSAEGQNALTVRPRELRPQLKRDKLDASRILVVTKPSVVATPSPEINSVLEELLSRVRAILGRCFVGMSLDGSVARGALEPDKSDLDCAVVTAGELSAETFRDLNTMHR